MRLTLRTLLAWLDDTLSPGEVREIGRQVSDSSFAKELVDRIHRVTRQRRLSVPPRTGADAVDANIVASYLDNELDPELVAELEKKCLTSDVHLAEVASVHQILSLIGQKAKVPAEARRRMYGLVRGREAVTSKVQRASLQEEPGPVSEPVQPWVIPPPPARPLYEVYGPAVGVLALIIVMCLTALRTLTPTVAPNVVPNMAIKNQIVRANQEPNKANPALPPLAAKDAEEPAAKAEKPAATEVAKADAKPAAERDADKPAKPASEIPAGAVGLAKKPGGILLRYNPERREWQRLTEATPLREQDRLIGLDPFRSTVELGTADLELVGDTEVWARATPATHAARLTLAQGRIVLHGTTPSLPFEILFAGKTITVTPPPGGAVGIERVNRRLEGESNPRPSVLRLFAADGPTIVVAQDHKETLDEAGTVTVEPNGTFTDKAAKAPPSWVTETEPPPFDQKVGAQFAKYFRADRPIVANLLEAIEDEQKDVARKAIQALKAVGDDTFIVEALKRRGDPNAATVRRHAITILRDVLAQDGDAAKSLHEQLISSFGDEDGATAEKLLIGYTPKEAADPATYARLVQILGVTDDAAVGVRELALYQLEELTGRDDLGYDPENVKPENKGLKAWRALVKDGDLRPAGAKPAVK
jgi:hypothetical protein